ncbi:hypothetical protein, partial [Bacillus thuringiensis]|uniref:hypothetical protein n=1 Tax=Bacillus thuringiensis TaxID=1428 RepID=UPI001C54C259
CIQYLFNVIIIVTFLFDYQEYMVCNFTCAPVIKHSRHRAFLALCFFINEDNLLIIKEKFPAL